MRKLLYTVWVRWLLYFAWSKIYRWLYHRKFRKEEIPVVFSVEELSQRAKTLTWHQDTFKEMLDAIGDPHYVQWVYRQTVETGTQPPGALDCDEFAVWTASMASPVTLLAAVLNVSWVDGLIPKGHNVALIQNKTTGKFYHTGNWGKHGPFDSFQATVFDIIRLKFGAELPQRIVGWAVFEPKTLRLICSATGAPKADQKVCF